MERDDAHLPVSPAEPRAAAIEASARIAHEADRALRASRGEPFMPAWADLPSDARERQVLRAERLLSLARTSALDDRFFAAVLRAVAVELDAHGVGVHAVGAPVVDRLEVLALETIADATANELGTTVKVLVGNARTRATSTLRNLAMLIARHDFGFSFYLIGFFFGGRNHATVMWCVESMSNRLRYDDDLCAARARICGEVRRRREP
jgi:Bacterial dnaA protein helix-turn-helix